MKADCCFVENGNPCDCGGVYRVTLGQLERTVAANLKRAKRHARARTRTRLTWSAPLYHPDIPLPDTLSWKSRHIVYTRFCSL